MKKLLTLLLCLTMTLSMMPSLVFAGDGVEGSPFAQITVNGQSKTYSNQQTFFEDFKSIQGKADVELLSNVNIDGYIPVKSNQEISLNLNGYTLSTGLQQQGRHYYAINNYGKLVISDSSKGQTGTIRARGIQNLETGQLSISGGTFVSVDENGGAAVWNEANLLITGGTFKTEYVGSSSDQYGPGCLNNQGTAEVKGGTFESVNKRTYAVISTGDMTVSNVIVSGAHGGIASDAGTLVIESGSFSSTEYYGLYVSNDGTGTDPQKAAVTVKGGTFTGKQYSVWIGSDINDPVNSTIDIQDGVFENPLNAQENTRENAIVVNGGIFKDSVTEYISDTASAATLVSGSETLYYVGTSAMVSERISAAAKSGDVVTVTQGDADFTLAAGVTVENSGTGEVSSNGQAVESPYVARIGNRGYETLQAAVDAVAGDTETTITLVKNSAGNGVKVPSRRNIIFDLNSYTYDINGETVGSTGTETNGFQLLKDSNITFKNGTVKSDKAIILIQNYCNLTLENVKLDGTATNNYVLSNNNGNTQLTGSTSIYAAPGKVAFDVCWWPASYPDGPQITVNTTGEIVGNIELGQSGEVEINSKATLTVQNGTFEGQFTVTGGEFVTSKLGENVNIYGGSFSASYGETLKDEYLAADMDIYKRTDGTFAVAPETPEGQTPSIEPTPGYHWEKDENGNYVEVANPYIPPTPTTQNPTIEADANATVVLSSYGTIATITVAEGYELVDVVLNGVSQGKVTTVTGLKTGDRLVVTTQKIVTPDEEEAAKNERLKEGVKNTTIKLTSTLGDGFIRLNWKKSLGYKVDYYEVYKSTKRYSGFGTEPYFETKQGGITGWYKNTKELKKGTRYYYKVRGVRDIAGETVYTQWSTKAWRLVK